MKKEDIINNYSLEDDGEFYYRGKKYASFRSQDGKNTLHVFQVNEDDDHEFVSQNVYREMLFLLDKVSIKNVKECLLDKKALERMKKFMAKNKNEKYTPDFEKEVKFIRRLLTWLAMCGMTAFLSVPVMINIMFQSSYVSYEELADRIPDDERSCLDILEEKNLKALIDNSSLKSLSDEEKLIYITNFMARCEKFYSLLTEEEQEVFKYQLSNMDIRFSTEYDMAYFSASEKYLELPAKNDGFRLELAFCDMISECYLEDGKSFVFNDFRNKEHNLYSFEYYNSLMFVKANYPEFTEELSRYFKSEKMIYYQMLLQVIDSDLEYLPFDVTIDDIFDSCKEIFWSSKKHDELFERLKDVCISFLMYSEEYNSSLTAYEKRNSAVRILSEYFIKKNKDFAIDYINLTNNSEFNSEEKAYLEESLIQELANRFAKYQVLTDNLNNANEIKVMVCESEDFEEPYYEALKEIYTKYSNNGGFSNFYDWESFKNHFAQYVTIYKNNDISSIEQKVQRSFSTQEEKQKVKELFHYPLSKYN